MDKMKRGIIILMFFAFIGFANAGQIVTPVSFSVNQSANFVYNITADNTDTEEIRQVNITFPVLFQINLGGEGTDASSYTFVSEGNIFSWRNSTSSSLIAAGEAKHFWFNASAPVPGDYTLTITTLNRTGNFTSTIPIKINDTTAPTINFTSPTPGNNSIVNDSSISINVSVNDNAGIGTVKIFLYDENGLINSASDKNVAAFGVTFNNLSSGVYYFSATVNDTSGFLSSTETRTISLNSPVSTCVPSWDYAPWGSCINGIQIRTVTDANDCNSILNKPNETQSCTVVCTPQWDYGNWSECSEGGKQTRTVIDSENCNSAEGKPATERTCEYKAKMNDKIWIFILLIGGITIAISGIAYLIIYLISKSLEPSVM